MSDPSKGTNVQNVLVLLKVSGPGTAEQGQVLPSASVAPLRLAWIRAHPSLAPQPQLRTYPSSNSTGLLVPLPWPVPYLSPFYGIASW